MYDDDGKFDAGGSCGFGVSVSSGGFDRSEKPLSPKERFDRYLKTNVAEFRRLAEVSRTDLPSLVLASFAERMEQAGAAPPVSRDSRMGALERYWLNRQVNPYKDTLVTAICKLGGINVIAETDWEEYLSHCRPRGFGLPGIEQRRGGGLLLDELAEKLYEMGYLQNYDQQELAALLGRCASGEDVYSLVVDDAALEECYASEEQARRMAEQEMLDGAEHSFAGGSIDEEVFPDSLVCDDGQWVRALPATLDDVANWDRSEKDSLLSRRFSSANAGGSSAARRSSRREGSCRSRAVVSKFS